MDTEVHDAGVTLVNGEVQNAPDGLIAADVSAQLIVLYLIETISIVDSERRIIAAFV